MAAETWESVFLFPAAPAAEPAQPVESKPKARMPMFASPIGMVTETVEKLGKASVESGTAMFVELPCFSC